MLKEKIELLLLVLIIIINKLGNLPLVNKLGFSLSVSKRAVFVLIEKYEKGKPQALLVQEMLGFRGLPGGRPDKGESDEAAAQREAREESGLEIQVKDLLTTGTEVIFYGAVKLSYRVYSGIITGGELNSQLQGAKFYSAHEVFRLANEEKLLGSYVTRAVARRFAYHAPP